MTHMKEPPPFDAEVITTKQLAQRWGVTPAYLSSIRRRGDGPPWWRMSERRIVYPVKELLAYERARNE